MSLLYDVLLLFCGYSIYKIYCLALRKKDTLKKSIVAKLGAAILFMSVVVIVYIGGMLL